MGRKNASETLIAIVDAFHAQNIWRQDELAERLQVQPRTVRIACHELMRTGRFPLERTEEHPHVYWSLPKRWVAGAIAIPEPDLPDLLRILARAPKSAYRDKLLALVLASAPPRAPRTVEPSTVVARAHGEQEEKMLRAVEASLAARRVLSIRYTSTTSGTSLRHVSPQRLDPGPPARVVAYCHRARELRWFRVDRFDAATMDASEPFVAKSAVETDAFIAASVDGYHGSAAPSSYELFVRDPEARWVAGSLPPPMTYAKADGGIVVTGDTTALERVASFVVGLGGAAKVRTPALRARVRELARAALDACAEAD